jgi:hypothetical protein
LVLWFKRNKSPNNLEAQSAYNKIRLQHDIAVGELSEIRRQLDIALGERNEIIRQRDIAIGEFNEIRRQLDIALGEKNEIQRQHDVTVGELNEIRRQLDIALGEKNEIQRQHDVTVGELNEIRRQLDIALGEKNEFRRQHDVAVGEPNEIRRQLDIALGEKNEFRRQHDVAVGEFNEIRRQLDIALGEKNEFRRQHDIAVGEFNEIRRQLDIALGERNEIIRQHDIAIGERNSFKAQLDTAHEEMSRLRLRRVTASPVHAAPPQTPNKSILFASLPKSGTEYMWGGLRDATGMERHPLSDDKDVMSVYLSGYCDGVEMPSTGMFTSERFYVEPMREALQLGCILGTHAPATYHNLCAIRDAGAETITVLTRDPRDSTVSWAHHLRNQGPALRNFNSLAMHLPLDYYDWEYERQLKYQIRTFLPTAVNWLEGWLDAPSIVPSVGIQFVKFTELTQESTSTFARILEFHGVGEFDLNKITAPTPGERNFRKGESGEWAAEFDDEDKSFSASLMSGRVRAIVE